MSPTSESYKELFCQTAVMGLSLASPSCASRFSLVSPSKLKVEAFTSCIIAPLNTGNIPVRVPYK
jgi:hypothetical protein